MTKSKDIGKKKGISSQLKNLKWPEFRKEQILFILGGIALIGILAKVFYNRLAAMLVLSPLLIPICKKCNDWCEDQKKAALTIQFKEFMTSVLTGLKAGYSAENAFREAYPEMEFQFGSGSMICLSLMRILRGLDNHIPLERLLTDFSNRSDIEEIKEFSEVFAITKKSGGSMTDVLTRSIHLIQSRMDVESEIAVMMSSNRMEQYIMDIVPIGIIFYVRMTSPGFFDVLYGNIPGMIVMTGCLAAYGVAYVMSERIMKIRV